MLVGWIKRMTGHAAALPPITVTAPPSPLDESPLDDVPPPPPELPPSPLPPTMATHVLLVDETVVVFVGHAARHVVPEEAVVCCALAHALQLVASPPLQPFEASQFALQYWHNLYTLNMPDGQDVTHVEPSSAVLHAREENR